jgi:hypothetical protein
MIHDSKFEKYALIKSNDWAEQYFSTVVQKFSHVIFPNHYCFKFEVDMFYIGNKVRPDLILIEKQFKDWWLVEVELERHSWLNHIQEQIEKILNAEITDKHQEKIKEKLSSHLKKLGLNENEDQMARVKSLINNERHKTLVIVDSEPKSWMNELQKGDARLMTVQVYRNERNDHMIRCDTSLPSISNQVVTYLNPTNDRFVPNWLEVVSPHRLKSQNGVININCENKIFKCTIRPLGNKTYLIPPSNYSFAPLQLANRLVLLEEDLVAPDDYIRYAMKGKVLYNG